MDEIICENCGIVTDDYLVGARSHPIEPANVLCHLPAGQINLCRFCGEFDRSLLGDPLAAHVSFCAGTLLSVVRKK